MPTVTTSALRFRRRALSVALLSALALPVHAGVNCQLFDADGNPVPVDSTAPGTGAVACGTNADASGDQSTAIGTEAEATAMNATAIGAKAKASAAEATAFGAEAIAGGLYSAAFGAHAQAMSSLSSAYGFYSQAAAEGSLAVGVGAAAQGKGAVAINGWSDRDGNGGFTPGVASERATAAADRSIVIGTGAGSAATAIESPYTSVSMYAITSSRPWVRKLPPNSSWGKPSPRWRQRNVPTR